MNRIGIGQVLKNAFQVTLQNLGIVLFIAVIVGGLGWAFADLVSGLALDYFEPRPGQPSMVVSQLAQTAALTLWGCTVGAWGAPASIYLWVQREKKQPTSLYESINYGLNRLPRVLPAHARAVFIIQLGLIVIVPGILFALQYAFVDAIATLDVKERVPTARSRSLTANRRGTIFRTFAVFLVWWLPMQLGGLFWLQDQGTIALAVGGVIDALVLILLDLCMVQYYLDLFRKPAAAPATATAPAAPAGD